MKEKYYLYIDSILKQNKLIYKMSKKKTSKEVAEQIIKEMKIIQIFLLILYLILFLCMGYCHCQSKRIEKTIKRNKVKEKFAYINKK